jgi:hypothetical protein
VTTSTWFRVAWSDSWQALQSTRTLVVQLAGFIHLRKFMVHETYLVGSSVHASPSSSILMPHVLYTVDWRPASGDLKRIFAARYRIPSTIATYRPSGGASDAFFQTHTAGDREIGFNQQVNYDQPDRLGTGTVSLNLEIINTGDPSDPVDGAWTGLFSVLGQY